MTISAVVPRIGRPPALSQAESIRLRKLYALGFPVSELAGRFSVDIATVKRHLGLAMPKPEDHQPRQPYLRVVPIRMIVTPWFKDPADGLQTRVVRAAE